MSLEPPALPSPDRTHLSAIDDALARLGRMREGEPTPVPGSVLNDNFRVRAAEGDLFVRIHRKDRDRERILREQRVATWANEHGIPAVGPLADSEGHTLWSSGGRLVSAYPFVAGRHLERGDIDATGAEVLGDMQGRLHTTLRDLPADSLPLNSELSWDTEASIAMLSRVDDLIRYYPAPGEERLAQQCRLREKLALLEGGEARPATDFASLPNQPTHGDYHERNVLLGDDGAVCAVVDWERASLAPRVFELLRAIAFMRLWEHPLLDAYLRGYRRHVQLDADECELGVEMWWQHDLHNTWAFRETFIAGDRRIAQFLEQNGARLAVFRDAGFRKELAKALA